MDTDARITNLILEALASVNELLPEEKRTDPSVNDGALFGRPGRLDSLGLVRLLASLEPLIEEEFSVIIIFGEDQHRWPELLPFRTVKTLAAYVSLLIKRESLP